MSSLASVRAGSTSKSQVKHAERKLVSYLCRSLTLRDCVIASVCHWHSARLKVADGPVLRELCQNRQG